MNLNDAGNRSQILHPAGAFRHPRSSRSATADEATASTERRRTGVMLSLLAALALAFMATTADNATKQRLLNGGALGIGLGALGTAVTGGCIPCGAVVGLATGTGAGYLYDTHEKAQASPVLAWRLGAASG